MTHVTQRNEDDAMEFLQTRPMDKPFYLTVAFFAAHAEDKNELQYLPQPEYTNLYKNVTIPVPVNATDESFYRLPPFLATETNEGRIRWHWRFDTPGKFQTMMKNYYRLCTGVDTTCGRIMDELQAQGVLDNTLIIFMGDNGYYHAEHGLADKWYPHEESIRVPLIIRDPRMTTLPGRTNDDFVLNVDLAPTILAATGIEAPATMQGRDITPLYTGQTPEPAWRNEYFEEHYTISNINRIPASRALVRKDWKYMYWPDYDTEQLFDLINDPIEENDLVNDPAYQAKLIEMRQRFSELQAEAQ
jgi:arylsulfatase A-like enzyme